MKLILGTLMCLLLSADLAAQGKKFLSVGVGINQSTQYLDPQLFAEQELREQHDIIAALA